MTRWRLHIALGLCSALPLLLFLYAADRLLRRNEARAILQRSQQAADRTGKVLEEKLADVQASLQAIAANRGLRDAWARRDLRTVAGQLEEAQALRRDTGLLAVYDASGSLQTIYPGGQEGSEPGARLLGRGERDPSRGSPRSFAAQRTLAQDDKRQESARLSGYQGLATSGWLASMMRGKSASVSPILVGPHRLAILVAVPLNPSGVLAGIYTPDEVKGWLRGILETTTKWILIVDQNGVQIFPPDGKDSGLLRNVSDQEEVKDVLAGKSGPELIWRAGKQSVVARHPISSCGWGLLVEIPGEEINKLFWQGERPVALLGLLFLALAAGVGGVVAAMHRRLRESEQHVRQIVTASTDAFIEIDADGNVTELNPRAEAMFGWPRAEAMGEPLHLMIIPERYRQYHLRGMEHFRASGEAPILNKPFELMGLHHDGHEFPVELSISHLGHGRKDRFNAFVRDISGRKRVEKEVAKLNAELGARVEQLEARNKELEAFSYSVSHDVRAPLRHIAGFSKMLALECGRQITPEGRSYLETIQNSAARMQRLVDDLLRFSRIGEQALRWQTTRLEDVVTEVIAGLKRELNGRNVTFEVATLPSVECDRSLMTQVFWNLLANAVKFTSTRERAVITIGGCRQDNEDVLFVRDNGVGFDMEHAGKLFDPFHRLHGDEFEGSGVGLATVQRIILKHKGRIWAEAKPDVGATFSFTLRPRGNGKESQDQQETRMQSASVANYP
jgi:PAS domain S-box-containing protein